MNFRGWVQSIYLKSKKFYLAKTRSVARLTFALLATGRVVAFTLIHIRRQVMFISDCLPSFHWILHFSIAQINLVWQSNATNKKNQTWTWKMQMQL